MTRVQLPETLFNGYSLVPADNPANLRRGGVGLFHINSLPVILSDDLSFEESIVVELKFWSEKSIFYRFISYSCF